MPAPATDLPEWATTAAFDPGSQAWAAQPRRDNTSLSAFAASGLVPDTQTDAESLNAWLGLLSEWISFFIAEQGVAYFGDGSDGVLSSGFGTLTLTRDMHYTDGTLSATDTIETAGFRLFFNGTLTMASGATIQNNGADATDGIANGPGAGAPAGSLPGGGSGASGPTGGTAGNGNTPTALDFRVADGGAGGDSAVRSGGAAASSSPYDDTRNGRAWQCLPGVYRLEVDVAGGGGTVGGGQGGSSGASDGGGATTAGAGGGGAGVVWVAAYRAVLASGAIIQALGGDGADAFNGSGDSGGGGGGGGGLLVFIHRVLVDSGATFSVAGGAGGAPDGSGVTGDAGSDGLVVSVAA